MIITFYSYKGGVGRSMAMANIGDILCRRGLRVLMVDFDLEAPGLEQFFQINVEGVRRHLGLLDLLLEYKQSMSVSRDDTGFRELDRYICPIYRALPDGGRLDILPAGQRQDPEQLERYALKLRTFDWQDFYYNWEGELFFEWLRRSLTQSYDVVLVDSRTGVTEMGGICGYQLADAIVMMCAANHQNMLGTANMVRDFRSANVDRIRRGRKLDIVVVPARVEDRLKGKDAEMLDTFFRRFDEAFAALVPEQLKRAGLSLRELMIPYDPEYAFEEQVVSDPARHTQRHSIGATFDKLACALALLADDSSRLAQVGRRSYSTANVATNGVQSEDMNARKAAGPETFEGPVPAQYDAAKRFAGYDVFLDYSQSDKDHASTLLTSLRARAFQVFFDEHDMSPGSDWQAVVTEALHHSHMVLVCFGPEALSGFRRQLLERFMLLQSNGQIKTVIPVLFPGANENALPTALHHFQCIDMRSGIDEKALASLHDAITGGSKLPPPQPETQTRMPYPGPMAFEEQQADLFFGRDALVHELVDHVSASGVIVITGGSGCGKTSLVHAGLIPQLRKAERMSGQRWAISVMRLGIEPLGLANIQHAIEVHLQLAAVPSAHAGKEAASHFLIIIDQFEELTYWAPTESAQLLSLLESVPTPHLHLSLLIVARVHLLAKVELSASVSWARWLKQSSWVLIPAMSQDELRRAISGPAERVGIAFEPGLVERIIEDMAGGTGALALLQEVLFRLWERRRDGWLTNAAYEEMGGLRGVFANRADAVYRELPAEQQKAVRSIMLRLTLVGSGKQLARRRVRFNALFPDTGNRETFQAAIDKLVGAGLLFVDDDHGHCVAEAAHELIIRAWAPVSQWVEEERGFLEWRERLSATMALWCDAGRNEDLLLHGVALESADRQLSQRAAELSAAEAQYIQESLAARAAQANASARRRRWVLNGAIALTMVFAAVSFFAVKQRDVANMQRDVANMQTHEAELALKAAKDQFAIAEKQRDDSNKALTTLQRNLDTLNQVATEATKAREVQAARLAEAEAAANAMLKKYRMELKNNSARAAEGENPATQARDDALATKAKDEAAATQAKADAAARQAKIEAAARQARIEAAGREAQATLTYLKNRVEASNIESNAKFEDYQKQSINSTSPLAPVVSEGKAATR